MPARSLVVHASVRHLVTLKDSAGRDFAQIVSKNGRAAFPLNYRYPATCEYQCKAFSPSAWLALSDKICQCFNQLVLLAVGTGKARHISGQDLIVCIESSGGAADVMKPKPVLLRFSEGWAGHGRYAAGVYALELDIVEYATPMPADFRDVVLRSRTAAYAKPYLPWCLCWIRAAAMTACASALRDTYIAKSKEPLHVLHILWQIMNTTSAFKCTLTHPVGQPIRANFALAFLIRRTLAAFQLKRDGHDHPVVTGAQEVFLLSGQQARNLIRSAGRLGGCALLQLQVFIICEVVRV